MSNNNSGGQAFNSEDFKAQQRQMWDNAAAGWQAWWPTFERGAQKVSDKIVELAEIKPGHWVLDIVTGIGEPAVTTVKKVMQDGKVVATDISPQMLAIAKTRAKSLGLDSVIEFRESEVRNWIYLNHHQQQQQKNLMLFFPDGV
jgi:ubiquinone/menaquinone biosynthesis C-methylase UbiE